MSQIVQWPLQVSAARTQFWERPARSRRLHSISTVSPAMCTEDTTISCRRAVVTVTQLQSVINRTDAKPTLVSPAQLSFSSCKKRHSFKTDCDKPGMPVYSGDFFQNMRTCQAWNMREKYAENMRNMLRSHVRYKLTCLIYRKLYWSVGFPQWTNIKTFTLSNSCLVTMWNMWNSFV